MACVKKCDMCGKHEGWWAGNILTLKIITTKFSVFFDRYGHQYKNPVKVKSIDLCWNCRDKLEEAMRVL